MPLYGFSCSNCGAKKECLLPMDECDQVQRCDCGADFVRNYAISGVHYKCDGFYQTDYKNHKGHGYDKAIKQNKEIKQYRKEVGLE